MKNLSFHTIVATFIKQLPNFREIALKTKTLNKVFIVWVCVALLVLSGCANLTSINRSTSLPNTSGSSAKAIHLDAKQRLVYSKYENKNSKNNGQISMLCAEPSPDALSAFAASFLKSGKSTLPDNTVRGKITEMMLSEAAGSIGLRTQSIQLMRDALYRTCEAYYNGAIKEDEFKDLHEQFQNVMVGVLAIEQLTGAVAAPAVVLNPGAVVIENINLKQNLESEGIEKAEAGEKRDDDNGQPGQLKPVAVTIPIEINKPECKPECKDIQHVSDTVGKIVNSIVNQHTVRKCLKHIIELKGDVEGIVNKAVTVEDIVNFANNNFDPFMTNQSVTLDNIQKNNIKSKVEQVDIDACTIFLKNYLNTQL